MASDGSRRGRPTDLTPEIQEALCAAIDKGVPIRYACALAEVGVSTFYGWIEKGERDEKSGETSAYSDFANAVTRARARKTERLLVKLEKYANETNFVTGMHDLKGLIWLLERTEQQDFAPRQKTEISGPNGGPVQMSLADVVRLAAETDEKESKA